MLLNHVRLGGLTLAATGLLVGVASAKPPQQAEPAAGAVAFSSKVEQAIYEKKLGLGAGDGSEQGGMVVRGTCPNTVVRTPALAIPDNAPAGVFDQMTTVGDPLSNVKVQLNILHSWQGDLIVTLSHDASGTAITLVNRPGYTGTGFGFSTDNYGNNGSGIPFVLDDSAAQRYDTPVVAVNNPVGSWLPDDPAFQTLSIFNGLTANTTWTLTVADNAGGDTGSVVRWAICSDNAIGTSQIEASGSASPAAVVSGDNTTINVQVIPAVSPPSTGITVTADLSQIGGSGSQMLADQGGNLYSFTQTVSAAFGNYVLPFVVTDLEGRMVNGTVNVLVVAANDECPGEAVTAPSSTAGTTVGMTPSGNTLCGANSADVFYNFTPTVSGTYTIDLCGSSFDTRLSVFTDCPAATLFPLGCNDDSACGLQSTLTLDLAADTTYYIRVSAFGAAVTGSYVLNISAPPIPTGGCCIANVCSISTEADCQANGGSYLGDNTNCGGPTQFTFSSSPALSIPDNNPAGVFDDIVIAAGETITDLDVGLFITHTWQGDLLVTLEHVDTGTVVTLIDRPGVPEVSTVGFSENNFGDQAGGVPFVLDDEAPSLQTYDSINVAAPGILNVSGSWLPDLGPLSAFDGQSSAGTWRLTVSDNAGADTGSVVTWGLIVNNTGSAGPCDANPCPEDWDNNGNVEVLDIFGFLTDWFANDPDAQNFGGTPGVPAIFAYLTAWFAHGVGPC